MQPRSRAGFRLRQTTCAGCAERFSLRHPSVYVCHFANRGFPFSQGHAVPCGVRYHVKCVRAGAPFETRLPNSTGLELRSRGGLPRYICECCQVRALVDRELTAGRRDVCLLMLERMRTIDIANNWRDGTMAQYGRHLRMLRGFSVWSGVSTLETPKLVTPPKSASIGIMYAQLQYSILGEGRKFQTVRQLRSAASAWFSFASLQEHPDMTVRDSKNRTLRVAGVSPSDGLGYTFFTSGLSRRMGMEVKPSMALSHVHVEFLDKTLEVQWSMAEDSYRRLEVATAATINLLGWLGWLRSTELFSLRVADVVMVTPYEGELLGLPPGLGAITLRLLPMTKSNPAAVADVVVSFQCLSGLSLGKWMTRLMEFKLPTDWLFSTRSLKKWTSSYFRHTWLYPVLECQRLQGESSLRIFQDINAIKSAFYSFHSFRRGGRSRCQKVSRHDELPHPRRRLASKIQVEEHGRWRSRHKNETMFVHYNEWELVDRLAITLVSM